MRPLAISFHPIHVHRRYGVIFNLQERIRQFLRQGKDFTDVNFLELYVICVINF